MLYVNIYMLSSTNLNNGHLKSNNGHLQVSCMRVMYERGVTTAYSSVRLHQTALHIAVDACQTQATYWLLQTSAATPVNTKDYLGETALHKAARRGHAEILEVLYKHGADFRFDSRLTVCFPE